MWPSKMCRDTTHVPVQGPLTVSLCKPSSLLCLRSLGEPPEKVHQGYRGHSSRTGAFYRRMHGLQTITISHLKTHQSTLRSLPHPVASLVVYFFQDVSPHYSSVLHGEDQFRRLLFASCPEAVTSGTEYSPN